ncbi:hypothetical protein EAKF1_ch3801 [Escherichia albertii KF1]|nr:hypothetical protein EAKF1_ch3801 [Escherichia albertii KF1]OSL33381.1 hypothetical protein EAPG_02080 [Escherichia albertii B156]
MNCNTGNVTLFIYIDFVECHTYIFILYVKCEYILNINIIVVVFELLY